MPRAEGVIAPARSVEGCFWDRGTLQTVMRRPAADVESHERSPRFGAMCLRSETRSKATVRLELQVGMPSAVAPYSRTLRASMDTRGYARSSATLRVVVTGDRFMGDLERVPFPEGLPLLVLHDPPGSRSFARYENAHA